jgi:oligoribonuclease (3'-5' exoribonuclease)
MTRLVWIDMETTSLDLVEASVLEMACLLTNENLVEVAPRLHVVTGFDGTIADPVVRQMHESSGLLDETYSSSVNEHALDSLLCEWLADHVVGDEYAFAGSGIAHFDVPLMKARMWEAEQGAVYWLIDVGILRRSFRMIAPALVDESAVGASGGPAKKHRAMDDVVAHLNEFRAYRDTIRSLLAPPDVSEGMAR